MHARACLCRYVLVVPFWMEIPSATINGILAFDLALTSVVASFEQEGKIAGEAQPCQFLGRLFPHLGPVWLKKNSLSGSDCTTWKGPGMWIVQRLIYISNEQLLTRVV